MISQKQAVYDAVVAFCDENNIKFEDGMKMEFNKEQRATIVGMLVTFTEAGEVDVKSEKARANLANYWNGTLSNWLRKDLRLNGNVKHTIKNPGSRAGSGDDLLKNLKKLKAQVELKADYEGKTGHIAEIQAEIDKRMEAIAVEKAAKVEVDPSKLPEHLKKYVEASA